MNANSAQMMGFMILGPLANSMAKDTSLMSIHSKDQQFQ